MKRKVTIRKVETKTFTVLVEAASAEEAVRDVRAQMEADDGRVYEAVNCAIFDLDPDDSSIDYLDGSPASAEDVRLFDDIDSFK